MKKEKGGSKPEEEGLIVEIKKTVMRVFKFFHCLVTSKTFLIYATVFLAVFGFLLWGIGGEVGGTERHHIDEGFYIHTGLRYFYTVFNPSRSKFLELNVNATIIHPFVARFIIGVSLTASGITSLLRGNWAPIESAEVLVAGRVPSALMGSLTALAVFYLAKEIAGYKGGVLACMTLLSIPKFTAYSRMAMLDVYVTAFSTLSSAYLYSRVKGSNVTSKNIVVTSILMGLALGSKIT